MANTANLRGTKLEVGQAQKEATINGLFDLLDSAVAGKLDVSITSADVTLTGTPAAPQAQNKYFNLSGTLTGDRSLVFPINTSDPATGNPRVIYVKNGTSGAFTVTVKVSGQTGVTVTQGSTAILLHNGTDFVKGPEWVSSTGAIGGSPGGSDAQVQFNDGGVFAGDSGLTFNKTSNVLSVGAGILSGNGSTSAPAYSFTSHTDCGMFNNGGQLILQPSASQNIAAVTSPSGTIQFHILPVGNTDSVFKMQTATSGTPFGYRMIARSSTSNWEFQDDSQVIRMLLLPVGGPVFPNTSSSTPVIFRQSTGTPGTDEGWIYHDGTDFQILNQEASASGSSVNVNGRVKFGRVGGNLGVLDIQVTKYLSTENYIRFFTNDGSYFNTATGSIGITPAADSGLTRMVFANDAGTEMYFYSGNGGTQHGKIKANANGLQLTANGTITAGGTTGAQTIDKSSGSVNFAAAATSLVVTNSLVTANSIILATVATNDSTMKSVQCVAGAGSFTIYANAAATAETRVNFWVIN